MSAQSSAAEIFGAFARVPSSEPLYKETLRAIRAHLTTTRALPLPADDVAGIAAVYERFYWSGFAVRASPTYADLMTATDLNGVARGVISPRRSAFAFLKDLQARNLVVPVVGDFGGPQAIRAVGEYLKHRRRDRLGVLPLERRAVL